MKLGWIAALALLGACAGPAAAPAVPDEIAERIRFEGASTFTRAQLLRAIELDVAELERRSSKRSVVDDAAYTLEQFYAERGFADARVAYTVEEAEGRLAAARFTIVEGARTRIERVELAGVARLSREHLLGVAGWSAVDGGAEPVWYSVSALRAARERIANEYAARGFLDLAVGEPEVELSADRTRATVELRVDEGLPYYVEQPPTLEGGLPEIDRQAELDDIVGKPYTLDLAATVRARVAEAYAWSGYADVSVSPARITPAHAEGAQAGSVALAFTIDPGPRVVIGAVRIEGNERTMKRRVLAELDLRAGDVWDVRKERESFRKLYRTGLFSRVALRLEPEQGETRTLVVALVEAPSSEFYAEPGYGSYEGLRLLAGWREKNLFGTGQSLEVESLVAELAQSGIVRLGSPHILDSAWDANVSLYREHRVEPSFDKDELGAGFGLAREFSRRTRLSAEYRYRSSDVSHADITDPDALAALQDVDISSIQVSPTWDTRDNPLGPTRGRLIRLVFEFASSVLGSELDFVRGGFTLSRFFSPAPNTVLAASARAGVIVPIEDTAAIPLQELYFNGGENTVRSFQEDQLGPKDSQGNPLGGEAYDVISLELRQRLYGNFEGALFYDGGNLVADHVDYFAFDDFRHALGVGLRYRLPIGPVRFDWGWNPDPRQDEDDWAAHLSVGMSF